MSDPKSNARAALLAGSLAIQPAAEEILELRVPVRRRIMPRRPPPPLKSHRTARCYAARS